MLKCRPIDFKSVFFYILVDVGTDEPGLDDAGGDDDDEEFKVVSDERNNALNPALSSKWTTRVFAAECVRKIMITSPHITKVNGPGKVHIKKDMRRRTHLVPYLLLQFRAFEAPV